MATPRILGTVSTLFAAWHAVYGTQADRLLALWCEVEP